MTYQEIIKKVSYDIGLGYETVDKAYKAFWLYIKNSIKELPLMEDLSEDDFLKLRTNFNIPSLGKISCTYDRYKGVKRRYRYYTEKYNEETDKDKAPVQ